MIVPCHRVVGAGDRVGARRLSRRLAGSSQLRSGAFASMKACREMADKRIVQ
ncbi:hypothetical protein ACWKSP_31540 [Micromonosporaceae bacterium Da 78-11]